MGCAQKSFDTTKSRRSSSLVTTATSHRFTIPLPKLEFPFLGKSLFYLLMSPFSPGGPTALAGLCEPSTRTISSSPVGQTRSGMTAATAWLCCTKGAAGKLVDASYANAVSNMLHKLAKKYRLKASIDVRPEIRTIVANFSDRAAKV